MKKSSTGYQSKAKRKVIYRQTRVKHVPNIFILQINLTKKIRIGVCCMAKKVTNLSEWSISLVQRSSHEKHPRVPIQIRRVWDPQIRRGHDLQQAYRGIRLSLLRNIQEWHRCDVFIGFYSNRFPLEKAISYVKKYQPKQINDLQSQVR
jgi:hypothetical protein